MTQPTIYNRWPAENPDIIQLYSMNTPNGMKASIMLEESGLAYEPHTINILEGDQFTEEYKTVSPNSKIPSMVDPNGPGNQPIAIMESGAILLYLAEKSGKLLPDEPVAKNQVIQWLFFQVGHIGPMLGQFGHFYKFARDKCRDPYPLDRYSTETKRLLAVLDRQLDGKSYLMGDHYTIADIAIFPWVNVLDGFYEASQYLEMDRYQNVAAWLDRCLDRPASVKGMTVCALK